MMLNKLRINYIKPGRLKHL